MSTLLERERELDELAQALADARAGAGRLVVIEAHAGLGKTRLLQAARELATGAGLDVLAARATELERDFPFALARQLFEHRLATVAPAEREALLAGAAGAARGALGLGDDGHRRDTFAVLHGLYWLTAGLAERHPLLLAVDDAHWADVASLDYLAFLLPRLGELPMVLAVACRPEEDGAPRGLAAIAADPIARRLTPRALSRAAAGELLARTLGVQPEERFAATCHEVSGGNPFLLSELAHTVASREIEPHDERADAVRELAPERVVRTVLLRLERLPPEARAVARALAVLGDDSDHRLVAALAGLDPDATLHGADALRAAAILDGGGALRFVHPLVRTAVEAEQPAGERGAAHGRAAELLRESGATPEAIAAHLVAADPCGDRATVETLLEAGSRALAGGVPRSAIAYLRRALRESPPADLRPAVLGALIAAILRAGEPSVFAEIESDVFAEVERDPALLPRWVTQLSPWLAIGGRGTELAALLGRAIDVAVELDDVDRALHLEGQVIGFGQVPPAQAQARLARYRDRVAPGGAGERLIAGYDAAWAVIDGTAAEAAPLARRALHDAKIFSEQAELLVPGEALRALVLADELDAAREIMDRALAVARERGAVWELGGALYLGAHVEFARGELAAGEADLRQVSDLWHLRRFVGMPPGITALLVTILIERGELAAAETALEAQGATEAVLGRLMRDALLLARGRLRLAQGRAKEAAEDLLEVRQVRQAAGTGTSVLMQVGAYAAVALAALGERDRARELAEEDLSHARRWGAASVVSRSLRSLGLVTGGADGLALLEEAVALLDGSPARLDHAHALTELGAARRRANHRADARGPLREALELARRCGATGLAKRAHDELLATGEKVRHWAPIGVDSLTPSERRVAELAASGMTNREIAQSLFLTVKTIETHLGAAYGKLGIHSRRQLPEALRPT